MFKPCPDCKKLVRYVITAKNGKKMPIDLKEHEEKGNVLIDGYGRAHVFANREAAEAAQEAADDLSGLSTGARYIPHVVTCKARLASAAKAA